MFIFNVAKVAFCYFWNKLTSAPDWFLYKVFCSSHATASVNITLPNNATCSYILTSRKHGILIADVVNLSLILDHIPAGTCPADLEAFIGDFSW